MNKLLLFSLILPALIAIGLFASLAISSTLKLSTVAAGVLMVTLTFFGFASGTFILIRLSNRIVNYAKVKKKC